MYIKRMAVGQVQHEESVANGLKFVPRTRILGRKRVVIKTNLDSSNLSSPLSGPLQKKHMERSNRLELLPQDVLVNFPDPKLAVKDKTNV